MPLRQTTGSPSEGDPCAALRRTVDGDLEAWPAAAAGRDGSRARCSVNGSSRTSALVRRPGDRSVTGTPRPAIVVRLLALLLGTVASVSVVLVVSAPSAQARSVYRASPSGSDSADGIQKPFKTVQKATDTAPAGATIELSPGTYAAFTVKQQGQTIIGTNAAKVVIKGRSGTRDNILIAAPNVTVANLTVKGCKPNPNPAGGFGDDGSSAIRIDNDANEVTVKDVIIRKSIGKNQNGLKFGCYGIFIHSANGSKILHNDISGTGSGIYFNYGGQGARVEQNNVHDNNVLVRNTPGGDDDYGAVAITFSNVQGSPGPTASQNTITGNSGSSADYEFDGGAFEIFHSSNVAMVNNQISNNENVLETGTIPGSAGAGDCAGNVFAGNTVQGLTAKSKLQRSVGFILRCATGMAIKDNTITDIDWWVYEIAVDDSFAGDVNGLTIQDNQVTQVQKVYHLAIDAAQDQVSITGNKFRYTGTTFASYGDGSTSPTLEAWRKTSGQDATSSTF